MISTGFLSHWFMVGIFSLLAISTTPRWYITSPEVKVCYFEELSSLSIWLWLCTLDNLIFLWIHLPSFSSCHSILLRDNLFFFLFLLLKLAFSEGFCAAELFSSWALANWQFYHLADEGKMQFGILKKGIVLIQSIWLLVYLFIQLIYFIQWSTLYMKL